MFQSAKAPSVQWAVVAIGVVKVSVTVLSVFLVARVTRRRLLLGSLVVMGVGLLGACVFSVLSIAIAVIFFILVYLVGYVLGIAPLSVLLVNELFDSEARSKAQAVAAITNSLSMLLATLLSPLLLKWIGGYTFLVYLLVLVEAFVHLLRNLPETKDRPRDDIVRELSSAGGLLHAHPHPTLTLTSTLTPFGTRGGIHSEASASVEMAPVNEEANESESESVSNAIYY